MARNETTVSATPEQVFEVLLDAYAYGYWVAGSRRTRAVDPGWPDPGSAFHHTSGFGPTLVRDKTVVVEIDPPRRLVLDAHLRPFAVMRVAVGLRRDDGGTALTIEEVPAPGTRLSRFSSLVSPLVHLRNAESLRRLKRLAERRAGEGAPPPRRGRP